AAIARRPEPGGSEHEPPCPRLAAPPTRILHVSAECWPLARTGGLGEAVAGLVRKQRNMGLAAYVVLPLYRTVRNYIEARGYVLKAVDPGVRMAIGTAAPVAVRCMRVCAPAPSGMAGSDPGWRWLARSARLI